MINILKLIRVQNLLIIALTQYLFRYCILLPLIKIEHITPVMGHITFALLVISTVLIAAAGYAINDYFDVRTDRINKPKKMLIGKGVSRRQAMLIHTVFSITAAVIGAYVSYKVGNLLFALINPIIATALWFYSTKYKAYFLVGNILIAVFSGLVVVVVWLYEIAALNHSGIMLITSLKLVQFFLWAYFIFAAMVSLIREIIKDIEDIEGDKKIGCTTVPVVIGIKNTKYLLAALSILTFLGLAFVAYLIRSNNLSLFFWYFVVAVCLPFLYMSYIAFIAKNKSDFTFLSGLTKFCLISGVMSMLVFYLN